MNENRLISLKTRSQEDLTSVPFGLANQVLSVYMIPSTTRFHFVLAEFMLSLIKSCFNNSKLTGYPPNTRETKLNS